MSVLFINYLQEYCPNPLIYKLLIVVVAWLSIAVFIGVDRKSGIRKAKERGEDILSKGLRRTITKGLQYYGFMIFAFILDCFIMLLLSAFGVPEILVLPFATIVVCIIILDIEYKSVKENSEDKIKRRMPDLVALLRNPDARSILREAINQLDKSKEEEKENELD